MVADLGGIDGTICRYFVICQGNSPSQVEAITESVGDFARKELSEKPDCPTYQEILDDIIKRDYQDMHRETAPLKQAEDAVLVDTTELNLEESAAAIVKIINEKIG